MYKYKAPICNIYSGNKDINDYGFYATHEVISFIIFLHILQLFLSAIKSLKGRNCFELDRIYFLIFYFTIPSVIEKEIVIFYEYIFCGSKSYPTCIPKGLFASYVYELFFLFYTFLWFYNTPKAMKRLLLTPKIFLELTDPFDNKVCITFCYTMVTNI